MKKFESAIAGRVSIAVIFVCVHAGARANGPLLPEITLSWGNTAQAAAVAGASASSNQAQTQSQTQTQNQTQAQISSSTATGGQGGAASNYGNNQIVNLNGSGVRNNPGIGLGLMVPTAPCRDTYSVGASAAGMGGALAWSKADRECRWQDIGAAFIRAGFVEDGLAMWCAIEGVEDIAPTCKRLKAAKQPPSRIGELAGGLPEEGE